MMSMKFIERENEILKALKKLIEAELDFIVVGGYAVSGLTRHRFSVDCDIVVQKRDVEKLEAVLKETDFTKHIEKAGFDEAYGGEFISYKKDVDRLPVTVDLLVGALVCRATEAAWSFDYIKEHSIIATISGMETSVSCRIPEKELLIALKMHSARRADIRDIVMLKEDADLEKILKHLKRGRIEALRGQISKIIEALNDPNLVDSLKGVFVVSIDVRKQIQNTRKDLEVMAKKVS